MSSERLHFVLPPPGSLDFGPHVFPVEKYALVPRLVREELGVGADRFHPPDDLTFDDLLRVHDPAYCDDLEHARETEATLSSELPVDAGVIQGIRSMAGGTVTALRLALEHGVGFHLGGGFHHAFRDHAEGFCYLNDIALAIEGLRAERGLGRVLIVDVDVHQGNGTASIFADDANTFTYSIHQERNYPFYKEASDLDRGLADGVGDRDYMHALTADLDAVDARFDPQLVLVVAGVDPYEFDQLGGLRLTPLGLEQRDEAVFQRYLRRGLPLAIVLAGGYARTAEETSRLHLGTVRAALRAAAVGG